jgi:hypothetical protein
MRVNNPRLFAFQHPELIGYATFYSHQKITPGTIVEVFDGSKSAPAVGWFVRPLLTASSVITVMPRNGWPVHCEGGIHYVWPCKLVAELALVIFFAIAAHVLRKRNKAAGQH